MYKATVRWMIRRSIAHLNEGEPGAALAMFADDATLAFPGDNTWSRMFREPQRGCDPQPTHRGKVEIEAFLDRYVAHGIQMQVDDILVNGPPWRARAAVVVHDWVPGSAGGTVYANRAVLLVRTRWGRIVSQEDFEDSEQVAAYDRHLAGVASA